VTVAIPLRLQLLHTAARSADTPEQQAQKVRAQYLQGLLLHDLNRKVVRSYLQRLCHLPQRMQQLRLPSLWATGGAWLLGLGLNRP
jgi:hypothetical protein